MRLKSKAFLISFYFFFQIAFVFSADVKVSGHIRGLTSSEKKGSSVVLESAYITAVCEGKLEFKAETNQVGFYLLELKRNKRYLITISRKNYNRKSIWINTKNIQAIPDKVTEYIGLDFLLLKSSEFPNDISLKEDLGQINYDAELGQFVLSSNRDYVENQSKFDNSFSYIAEAKTKNPNSSDIKPIEKNSAKEEVLLSERINQKTSDIGKSIQSPDRKLVEAFTSIEEDSAATEEKILEQRVVIEKAKEELAIMKAMARTEEDNLNISRLENQIKVLELALNSAENTIRIQKEQLEVQKELIRVYVLSSILLLGIILIGIWFYRDKVKSSRILGEKNQLITDGITYANTIQSSFLKSPEEIRKILPDFALFFKPRDIVSGDIYWVSQEESTIIIAAIDCTGHGVPGAFISMIANTLLNEIVRNQKIVDPATILGQLHSGVMDVLQQDSGNGRSQDGMDMSLMVFDRFKRKISFAGARNHMIRISNGEVEIIRADVNSIGGRSMRSSDGFNKSFTTKEVMLNSDSTYYLFSDGFADQFGGPEGKKYNLLNFQQLLTECAKLPYHEQETLLGQTFEKWKGDRSQLDDVLVIGVRI